MLLVIARVLIIAFICYLLLVELILTNRITENFDGDSRLFVEFVIVVFSLYISSKF